MHEELVSLIRLLLLAIREAFAGDSPARAVVTAAGTVLTFVLVLAAMSAAFSLLAFAAVRRNPSLGFAWSWKLPPRTRCPVCRGLACGPWAVCPRCETPQHLDCADFTGACATYGCGFPEAGRTSGS